MKAAAGLLREDVQQYVHYGERLAGDLEVCIEDLCFRFGGGKLHVAVDFSEIHAFLLPQRLPDDWLWPGLAEDHKALVEHSALSQVLTGPPKPILLTPYRLEFQSFLSAQGAALAAERASEAAVREQALATADEMLRREGAGPILDLALKVERGAYQPSSSELASAVKFFEDHGATLVSLVCDEVLHPVERAKAFLKTSPFQTLDSVLPIQLTGAEPQVTARFNQLKRLRRGRDRDGASFMDALALEYVLRANAALAARGEHARVVLVSRSSSLRRLVLDEVKSRGGTEADVVFFRHPRSFAPLAWHPSLGPSVVSHLEGTLASLRLCCQSAQLRLRGNWNALDMRRIDRDLASEIEHVKAAVLILTQMGGGVNESRVVLRKGAPTEDHALRLLAMLRNRDEILSAVERRMAEINDRVDRAHELIGMLLHLGDQIEAEVAVLKSGGPARTVAPRMGRLPYGLRFEAPSLVQLLDDLRRRPTLTPDGVREVAIRATEKVADHYETLLFMAYVLALLARYELAAEYCGRALESAERHGRRNTHEARFFKAFCLRRLASTADDCRRVIALLDSLVAEQRDARVLAEQGNVRILWNHRAAADVCWTPAPTDDDAIEWLLKAIAACDDDTRLLVSVRNSLCVALTHAYVKSPSDSTRREANDALAALTEALYSVESEPDNWPLRVKDTIAESVLKLNPDSYDASFLRKVIDSIEDELQSDIPLVDRSELSDRLRSYQEALQARLS